MRSLLLGGACAALAACSTCGDQAICGDENSGIVQQVNPPESSAPTEETPSERASDPVPQEEEPEAEEQVGEPGSEEPEPVVPPKPVPTVAPSLRTVTLRALCNAPGHTSYICGLKTRTKTVGETLFSYQGTTNPNRNNKYPEFDEIMGLPSTTCKTITLQFGADAYNMEPDDKVVLRVLQSSGGLEAEAKPGKIGNLTVTLNGGPFKVEGATTNGNSVVANGTAECFTANGVGP
ncbi:hypothetical protein [Streptomyces cyaneofuscatus]|uniref:hypothetical protein n=1 Tax=Streptomyces cyaneofuscatus TaxID=66883 RepID=UPI0034069C82